jgi:LPS sulfotransferase NodH
LGEWLATELTFDYHHEPFNKKNQYNLIKYDNFLIENQKDCIIKISPADGYDFENLKILFDKSIVVYREDTLAQAESMLWAQQENIYHHTHINDKMTYAYYSITDDWLIKNKKYIDLLKKNLDLENKIFKSLKDCLIITYEELYYSNLGIKKLEEYIEFNAKSKFNKVNKLRDGNLKNKLL